jgi:hypothetical protein
MSEEIARKLIEDCGGKVIDQGGPLPDGSGFMIGSFPLPKTHWIYGADKTESYGSFNTPPMVLKMGANEMAIIEVGHRRDALDKRKMVDLIRAAGKYAVRCATMNGKEMDFDPDALLQNLVVGFLGYWTDDGLDHDDDWANPPRFQTKVNEKKD